MRKSPSGFIALGVTYVADWEDGRPELVAAFDVIEGETGAALLATERCR